MGDIYTCVDCTLALGIQSSFSVQPLINDLDTATLMDPQETLHLYTTIHWHDTSIILLVCIYTHTSPHWEWPSIQSA